MGLSGSQSNNLGYQDADVYFQDPANAEVPNSHYQEHDIGVTAFNIEKTKDNLNALLTLDKTRIYSGTSEVNVLSVDGDISIKVAGIEKARFTPTGLDIFGSMTSVNTTNLEVVDSLISLAKNNNGADIIDIGFFGLYDTSGTQDLYCGLFRNASDNKFHLFVDSQENLASGIMTINTGAVGYTRADLELGNVNLSGIVNINNIQTLATPNSTSIVVGDRVGITGTGNVVAGINSAIALTTGSTNTIVGYQSFRTVSTTSNNVGVGYRSGRLSTGTGNTFLGSQAGSSVGVGSSNTFIGNNSGQNQTTGSNNICIGASSALPSPAGSNQISIGNLIYADSNSNVGIGTTNPVTALEIAKAQPILRLTDTTGTTTNFSRAGLEFYYGSTPNLLGSIGWIGATSNILYMLNETGGSVILGKNLSNTTLTVRTSVNKVGINTSPIEALDVLGNTNLSGVLKIGTIQTLATPNATSIVVGDSTVIAGTDNSIFGIGAGSSNTGGNGYTIMGYNAGTSIINGGSSVIIGSSAFNGTAANNSVLIGSNVGSSLATTTNSVYIGRFAGNGQTTGDNNIAIGYNSALPSLTGSNQISIGNLIYADSNSNVGIGTSAPTEKLEIAGSATRIKLVDNVALTQNASTTALDFYYNATKLGEIGLTSISNSDLTIKNTVNAGINLFAGVNGGLSVNWAGNVGIGTTVPAEKLDVIGNIRLTGYQNQVGMVAPALSAVGSGRIYFDSTSNTYKVSENGGAFVNLVGGGGGAVTSVNTFTGAVVLTTTNITEGTNLYYTEARVTNNASVLANTAHSGSIANPHSVTKAQIGLSNVVNLDTTNASNITTGTLPNSVLPPLAITSTQTAISEVAMLALTTQEGDVVVRTDVNKTFIRNAGLTGTITDFNEILSPTGAVTSVNGLTGVVSLTTSNINEGTNLYYTEGRVTANVSVSANTAHAGNTSNPHGVTVTQVGAVASTGGTFTGVVTGVTPTATGHLATKGYVDSVSGGSGGVDVLNIQTATATTVTVAIADNLVRVDTILGAITVNLPDIDDVGITDGHLLVVKDRTGNASINNVTIIPNATVTADTIDESNPNTPTNTYILNTNYESVTFRVNKTDRKWEAI